MNAFSYDSLWTKSKVYLDLGLRARDDNDPLSYYLWAAASLELLAKATLAHIHPALVADPTHFQSLAAACGRSLSTQLKSVTARTVYERLHGLITAFDERMKREAQLMADRRNAELHSGETPVHGLDPRAWVPAYWRAVDVLVTAQSRSLEDWVGLQEASSVTIILADSAQVRKQAVLSRIERRKAAYLDKYPPNSGERTEAALRAHARSLPARFTDLADDFEEARCPACATKAWLFGHLQEEEIKTELGDRDEDGYYASVEIVQSTYAVEELRCPECGLELEGRDEIAIAGVTAEFAHEDIREPDYEPDYGND